jgi:hypothetical protein
MFDRSTSPGTRLGGRRGSPRNGLGRWMLTFAMAMALVVGSTLVPLGAQPAEASIQSPADASPVWYEVDDDDDGGGSSFEAKDIIPIVLPLIREELGDLNLPPGANPSNLTNLSPSDLTRLIPAIINRR